MGAHAHYSGRVASRSVHLSTLVVWAFWAAILAASVWFIGIVVGGEFGAIVTSWFPNW